MRFRKTQQRVTDPGRVMRAAGYSLSGLRAAFRTEAAFRQEVIVFALLAPLGLWLGRDGVERALLLGSLFQVLIVELLNSAVEAAVDRVGRKWHELAGRAKDMGSAAVALAVLLAALTWVLVLADH
ncbi:MAG: diacylglycerol kinase [Acidiferrobacterales bacterium]